MLKEIKKILNDFRAPYMHMQWRILYSFKQKDPLNPDLSLFKELKPPKHKFWADPFVINENNRTYIFFEEYDFNENIGYIVYSELSERGLLFKPKIILRRDYHLSYPFIFKHEDDFYMIPESYQSRTVSLYKCADFPSRWELECNLIENIEASDSTVIFNNGLFYLFTTMQSKTTGHYSDWNELHIYCSAQLRGKWLPHKLNPIITGLRGSRMAGRIFEKDGKLYRPSQDNRKRYGHGLIVNEIKDLSPDRYSEFEIKAYYPWKKQIYGCHHIDRCDNIVVLDGEKYCFKSLAAKRGQSKTTIVRKNINHEDQVR